MPTCEDKFWTQRFVELFCEIDVIPLAKMSLGRQLNAITRMVIFLTLLMIPFCGFKSLIFLCSIKNDF